MEEEKNNEKEAIVVENVTKEGGDKKEKYVWETELYGHQSREIWPGRGQHILAMFNDEYVVVYQAFKGLLTLFLIFS